MATLLTLLLLLSTAVIGSHLLKFQSSLETPARHYYSQRLLGAGCAVLMVFLFAVLAHLSAKFQLTRINMAESTLSAVIIIAGVSTAVLLASQHSFWPLDAKSQRFGYLSIMLTVSAPSIYLAINQPLFAWDVLQGGEWLVPSFADRAAHILEPSQPSPSAWNPYDHRHPPTNFLLLAWAVALRCSLYT